MNGNVLSSNNSSKTIFNVPPAIMKKHYRRESMTIDIEEDNSSPFAFAELKEMDNESSTDGDN